MVTNKTAEESGFDSRQGRQTIFAFPQYPDWLWGSPSLLSNGYQGDFPRGESGRDGETDYLPPSSVEIKTGGTIPPIPHTSSWRCV
jgi:hypothetical protein